MTFVDRYTTHDIDTGKAKASASSDKNATSAADRVHKRQTKITANKTNRALWYRLYGLYRRNDTGTRRLYT